MQPHLSRTLIGSTLPLQEFAVSQQRNPYQSTRLLLDGQQRLTSLSAVIRGEHVKVRGRKRPIELLFNLEHPDQLAFVTEVNEEASDDEDIIEDEADSTEDELQRRFDKMTFVVATRKLAQLPHWVRVSEVFKTDEDARFCHGRASRRSAILGTQSTASAWPVCAPSAGICTVWTCWSAVCPMTK